MSGRAIVPLDLGEVRLPLGSPLAGSSLLIRAFVDEVAFRRRQTGMEITLTKRVKRTSNGDS